MKNGKRGALRLWWIYPACVFLFHPTFASIDLLPDAVGYAFLVLALSRLADLNEEIAEAVRRFRAMILVGIGVLAVDYFLYVLYPRGWDYENAYERPTLFLLLSFAVAILQCVILIPAYRGLFGGIETLAEAGGGRVVLSEKEGETACRRTRRVSTFFVLISSLLTVLPEIPSLFLNETVADLGQAQVAWEQYVSVFRVFGAGISLIVGTVWLIRMIVFFAGMQKDEPWYSDLQRRCAEINETHANQTTQKRLRFCFLLISLGALFTLPVKVDARELIPDPIGTILIGAGFFAAGNFFSCARKKQVAVCGILPLLSGIVRLILTARLMNPYGGFLFEGAETYVRVAEIADGAAAGAFVVAVIGYFADTVAETAILSRTTRRSVSIRCRLSAGAFFLAAAGNAITPALPSREWLWWIPAGLVLLGTGFLILSFGALIEELQFLGKSDPTRQ